MGTEVTTREKPKSSKKGGPKKKSAQNGVDSGANNVNRVGRETGEYQQPKMTMRRLLMTGLRSM